MAGGGGSSSVGGNANNFGFNTRSASGSGGRFDYATSQWLFGAAAGFGQTRVKQDVTTHSGTINTVQGGLYGAWRPGPYTIAVTLTYAHHSIDATRRCSPQQPCHPMTPTALAPASRSRPSGRCSAAPSSRSRVLSITRCANNFNETGLFLPIAGNATTVEALKGYAGARLWRTFDVGTTQVTPEVRGRVLYDMLDDTRGFSASFIADPARVQFPVTGIQPNRLAERLGAGVSFNPMWRASLNYDAEFRGGDVGHYGSGAIRASW